MSGGSRWRSVGANLLEGRARWYARDASDGYAEDLAILRVDLLIVGAGPAGMAAAITACRHQLNVMVIDDQPAPGGQIWRSVEAASSRDSIFGSAYVEGRSVAEAFRRSGALYQPGAQLWKVEAGFRAFVSWDRQTRMIETSALLLATGAQERPVPFSGWTLPGVLTVGAAQILLKSAGQIPDQPVWIAGSGPLPLLYAVQLLSAGGRIAGFLDTTPAGQWKDAIRHLPGALRAWSDVVKGLSWRLKLRVGGIFVVRNVCEIEALGDSRLETLRYQVSEGAATTAEATTLLVHEGVVPNIHAALSLDCAVDWNAAQDCYVPAVDEWGESSRADVFIVGDSAGIAGARAAKLCGELAAIRIAHRLGRLSMSAAEHSAGPIRSKLERERAIRPFLDALFKPRSQLFAPTDQTIVCRCEEVTAGDIRTLASIQGIGPNKIKASTRAGMGPCQGRQCGYTVTRMIAAAQHRSPADVGFFHIRPPLKPVTLGELASMDQATSP
jgi:NADPH-dependent 2,4-dienoyl-CoA reductase/sulfur reductase-like enzyme